MFEDTCSQVLLDGEIIAAEDAKTSIFDRGYLFADGVYEGVSVYQQKLIDNQAHLDRLTRSLKEVAIVPNFDQAQIKEWQQKLIDANKLAEGFLYLQITRAIASRDFHYPTTGQARIMMFAKPMNLVDNPKVDEGVKVCVVDDLRWKRRDIKSIALLPQAMAKQQAVEAGCVEAWMQEDGYITEGSSTSTFVVIDNTIVTRPLSNAILPGITRAAVLALASEQNLAIEERLFSRQEAMQAEEAFITSASNLVMPVVSIDGQTIGDGKPGATTLRLRQAYIERFIK